MSWADRSGGAGRCEWAGSAKGCSRWLLRIALFPCPRWLKGRAVARAGRPAASGCAARGRAAQRRRTTAAARILVELARAREALRKG